MENELLNYILDIDTLSTKEFCEANNIELPSWKGDVTLAASEFIRLDAIKWKMAKEKAKEIKRR